jgi:hypothetical protein
MRRGPRGPCARPRRPRGASRPNPIRARPPGCGRAHVARDRRSSTTLSMPARCRSCASRSPDGPPPMMQTCVRTRSSRIDDARGLVGAVNQSAAPAWTAAAALGSHRRRQGGRAMSPYPCHRPGHDLEPGDPVRRGLRIVAVAQEEFPQHYPASGWVEHDCPTSGRPTAGTCRAVIERAHVAASRHRRHRHHQPARDDADLGPQDRAPVHNAIVWQDRRTADLCQR